MNASYLRVKNWCRFQHYAKRRPPWIKLYNNLLGDNDEFMRLTEEHQWQLVRLWIVASRSSAFTLDEKGLIVPVIANDEQSLRRSIMSLKKVPVELFVRDGWLIPVAEEELHRPEQNASAVIAELDGAGASALLDREKQSIRERSKGFSSLPDGSSEKPSDFQIPQLREAS